MIEINNCYKKFEYPVLNNINLKINNKEFVILNGVSGTGKTTLLNIIAGIIKPDKGKVFINNKQITNLNDNQLSEFRNKYIGYIHQKQGLVKWLNVYNNLILKFYLNNQKISDKTIDNFINEFDIKKILNQYPDKISGGQYQRVSIISSIINSPDIILADEPANNLDKNNLKLLYNLFKKLKNNTTIILVSHNEMFNNLSDRIVTLENGIIKQ